MCLTKVFVAGQAATLVMGIGGMTALLAMSTQQAPKKKIEHEPQKRKSVRDAMKG